MAATLTREVYTKEDSNAMHLVEDLLLLALDFEAQGIADGGEAIAKLAEGDVAIVDINDHHHIEVFPDGGLGDVEDVDVVIGQVGANGGDNAYCVFSDYGYYGAVHRGGCFIRGSQAWLRQRQEGRAENEGKADARGTKERRDARGTKERRDARGTKESRDARRTMLSGLNRGGRCRVYRPFP